MIPTLIQEVGEKAKTIEAKLEELAKLPKVTLNEEEMEIIAEIGDNQGCMELKGSNPSHVGEPMPDRWGLLRDHEVVAEKWGINPGTDLIHTHASAK